MCLPCRHLCSVEMPKRNTDQIKEELQMEQKKILIVDDEKDVLSMLKKRLRSMGYSVIATTNGKDALMLANSEHPDIIVLDILMPGMDGTEVAARLKEDPKTKDTPIVFLTCLYAKAEESENGHQFGDELIFAKPYDSKELVDTIERLL